ncbi:MAG: phospho-sugar mutase, partial [Friedmanniella sp.]|nr:phospho-sugar mutase [Friedmanniella sp.]
AADAARGHRRRPVSGLPVRGLPVSGLPESGLSAAERDRVEAWASQVPDPATRRTALDLLARSAAGEAAATTELRDAFTGRLTFGTAGLRAALGPGPNRMNRVVVSQAAAGLARYLREQGMAGGSVVVGFDARHSSDVFARDTAEILAGAGFHALLTAHPVPTPVLAFGIRHLGCVAGVVVTASHNPALDNGYKVYLGDGSQIVPPADVAIAAQIDAVAARPLADIARRDEVTVLGEELRQAYLDRLATLAPANAPRAVDWVYTPMHGVGGAVVARVVATLGLTPPTVVAEQAEPDPDFPTVAFPNPEEPGAIDLALDYAVRGGADLVVANDPDADRCAVAVPVEGRWRMLRGDELGILLGEDALRRGFRGTYACSVVSSSLLGTVAAAYGQPFVATLTGFKWIGRVSGLVYGYEEAIGYCVDPEAVPDKDGISALVRVLLLAAELKAAGLTLVDRLDEITARYGVHETDQLSFRVTDLHRITEAMVRLRADPPARLVDEPVTVRDLAAGSAELPPTDAVLLSGPHVTVVVRPSGTEPKLKCYLECRPGTGPSADVAADRRTARATLHRLRAEMTATLGLPN